MKTLRTFAALFVFISAALLPAVFVTPANANEGVLEASVNEGQKLTLTAPLGSVFTTVLFASYGTPVGNTLGKCHSSNSSDIVSEVFLGKNSGTISATNNVFGDPCRGVGKKLTVSIQFKSELPAVISVINSPTNLVGTIDNGIVTLTWTAPSEGISPERYAIFFSNSSNAGWGIATGNVGDSNALNTTITIGQEVFAGSGGLDSTYQFSIRSDNDTQHFYSGNSNTVELLVPNMSRIAAEQAAAKAEADRLAAEKAAAEAEAARLVAEAKAAEKARLEKEAAAKLAAEQEAARIAAEREAAAKAAYEKAVAEAAAKAEADRLAAEAAAKAAAELKAKQEAEAKAAAEAAAKAEEERLAAEAAAAKAEAERIAAEQAAAKAEAERLAAEKAAAEQAEKERLAAEAAAKAEADRLAAEKAAAEAKAAEEKAAAEAKAAEEARLKAEADAKAAEEAKAKAETEAKVAADKLAAEVKAAAELKAKQEAEAKVAADKAAAEKEAANKAAADKLAEQEALKKAAEEGKLNEEQKTVIATALIAAVAPGEAVSADAIKEAGIEYKDLPPATPVDIRTDENGNAVVITAEVAAQVEMLQDPGALLETAFSDPGAALAALGSIGADMSPAEREEATNMVVATVVAAGAAMNAVGAAAGAAGGSTSGGNSGGGNSGGGGSSGESKGVRRRKP